MLDTLPATSAPVATQPTADRTVAAETGARALWISWERHRRTRELSRDLAIELSEMIVGGPALTRYPALLLRTLACLARTRPAVVVVQCPSIVLAAWVLILKSLGGFQVVADLHNEAVEPFIHGFPGYRALLRWIHRRADLSLVTNGALAGIVRSGGGRVLVLPDKVPSLGARSRRSREHGELVVFVCTYAPDEPYTAVIEAARLLGPRVSVHITGNPGPTVLPELPSNVTITGYLSETRYLELLAAADVIVDLTAMEDCLVCGAYEAAALGKPLVTSDTSALRAYFRSGTVYSRHDPESLAESIAVALRDKVALGLAMVQLRTELSCAWQAQRDDLAARIARGGVR